MRILHTSDWHLGRSLEGRDRHQEQEAFINELCDIVEQEKVDLVLIAGDIYDTPNPPAKAEQLFYQGLFNLSAGGRRGIVAIAGNHDNPERITASDPLAEQLGITLLGLPKEQASVLGTKTGKVQRVNAGPGWLKLAVPGCSHQAVIIALPYPSEQRLKEILAVNLDEEVMQKSYSQRVGALINNLSSYYRHDTVNLCLSHLFVRGGRESESERPIQLGGSPAVDIQMLPLEKAHYTALGHLHRPQRVGDKENARYSGSPLAYSFSEAGQTKVVYLIECSPGSKTVVKEIPLSSGRPLVRWDAPLGIQQVFKWCQEKRDYLAWIDLAIHLDEPLTIGEIKQLKEIRPDIINIRPVLKNMVQKEAQWEDRINLPIDELFKSFYMKNFQSEPKDELLKLFLELVDQGREVESQ
ncbi:MAG: exonuclease SbcCD subunit D [Bacillota bacterium]